MSTAILIPARLEASRFPNKMLADVGGKSLIKHVFDKCNETDFNTYVVTDSEEIAKEVPNFIMTGHADNGTERCCRAMREMPYNNYVNVQGDMIDITEDMIRAASEALEFNTVSTIYTDMPEDKQNDPNTVKMVSNEVHAHWFCRASLPYGFHHLGVYGYKKEMADIYLNAVKYNEEEIEKLEQLRWIQNGVDIGVHYVPEPCIEINTPEDLQSWMTKTKSS
ncbi:MAG: hypothetical protein CMA64_05475 [Euryarchaeota archaeon]|mgnify:CR=1 FL=1|nr:hypothetical protein [Euryarchaeota archaeon]